MNRVLSVMKTSVELMSSGWSPRCGLKSAFLVAILASQALLPASAQEKGAEINMVVGEVQILPMPPSRKIVRIGIGNGKLFGAKVLEKEGGLIFVPENPGRTNLLIWTADGGFVEHSISVLPANIETSIVTINNMLKGINNVRAERAGDTILITGSTTKINMPRIEGIAKSFPMVYNAVRDEELEMKRMVYMRVQIVEMKKSLTENIGVAWTQSAAGPAAGVIANIYNNPASGPGFRPGETLSALNVETIPNRGFGWKPVVALTSIITSTINLGVSNGDVFVIATPELSTRSGGKAEFLAGGQIPIVSPASGTSPASVQFKDYGIKLSIEPVADDKGNVSTTLDTEISSVDPASAVQGNPGFLTRKTKSQFNVQEGQTIVISGLVDTFQTKDTTKLAGLGNLPILGALFRSNNFRTGRTDLVILVTPTVVDPTAEAIKKVSEIQNSAKKFAADEGILLK